MAPTPGGEAPTPPRHTLSVVSENRGLGRRLEDLVGGIAGRRHRRQHVEPIDLGSLLVAHAAGSISDGPAGPVAPNRYTVTVPGEPADPGDVVEVERGLAALLTGTALEEGWRLEGPVAVQIGFTDVDGDPTVESTVDPGHLEPWAHLHRIGADHIAPVAPNRAVVGRSADADVTLDDDTVSRRHAMLLGRAGTVFLTDLGSSNGTYLNGTPVADAVEVIAGDVLGFGEAAYTFRPVGERDA